MVKKIISRFSKDKGDSKKEIIVGTIAKLRDPKSFSNNLFQKRVRHFFSIFGDRNFYVEKIYFKGKTAWAILEGCDKNIPLAYLEAVN